MKCAAQLTSVGESQLEVTAELTSWNTSAGKRLLDAAGATVLLVVLSPLMCLLALLIKLSSAGTVFYRQRRVGQRGREFQLLKFRSMAPARPGLPLTRAGDPRITRVGRFLRKWKLDELPQLFNVLKGEMSLVGPRPEPVERVKRYSDWQRQRLTCKPGVTGLAQVHGLREENSSEDKAYYDLRYIQDWSLLGDLSLILQTIWTISRRFLTEAPAGFEMGSPATEAPATEFIELAHADRS